MKITPEMLDANQPNLLQQLITSNIKAIDQENWCMIYTGRSWQYDLALEWAPHLALMCDADEVDFGDPLLAPVGGCKHRHPYDIAMPCALRGWEHAKLNVLTDEEVEKWWNNQR
jgi:hypothetical protein